MISTCVCSRTRNLRAKSILPIISCFTSPVSRFQSEINARWERCLRFPFIAWRQINDGLDWFIIDDESFRWKTFPASFNAACILLPLRAGLHFPPALCNTCRDGPHCFFFRKNLHKTRVPANIDFRARPRLSTHLSFDTSFSPGPRDLASHFCNSFRQSYFPKFHMRRSRLGIGVESYLNKTRITLYGVLQRKMTKCIHKFNTRNNIRMK